MRTKQPKAQRSNCENLGNLPQMEKRLCWQLMDYKEMGEPDYDKNVREKNNNKPGAAGK